jgi:hypothetical protein
MPAMKNSASTQVPALSLHCPAKISSRLGERNSGGDHSNDKRGQREQPLPLELPFKLGQFYFHVLRNFGNRDAMAARDLLQLDNVTAQAVDAWLYASFSRGFATCFSVSGLEYIFDQINDVRR